LPKGNCFRKRKRPLSIGRATGVRPNVTPVGSAKNYLETETLEIRTVTVSLNKLDSVPTVQIKTDELTLLVTLMLDTESDPDIIKENIIPKDLILNSIFF